MANLANTTESITSIYRWYTEGKLVVNRRYQRKLVWTLEEKQKLIQSIIDDYPIPAIILSKQENGKMEIIDGLQRLHSIISFVEHGFDTLEGKRLNLGNSVTAKNRANSGVFKIYEDDYMDINISARFFDYHISLSIMQDSSNEEIDEVFRRINTYGRRLSNQERRQAGIKGLFSNYVKNLADEIRTNQISAEILDLSKVASISIEPPTSKLSYGIISSNVFWVRHGVINSNNLRDSLDEECLAGIIASIVRSEMVSRTRDVFDEIYRENSPMYKSCTDALRAYGESKLHDEIIYCIEEFEKIVDKSPQNSLKNIVFSKSENKSNPYPSVFTLLFVALHRSIFDDKLVIHDYGMLAKKIDNIGSNDNVKGNKKSENLEQAVNIIKEFYKPAMKHNIDHDSIYKTEDAKLVDHILSQHPVEDTFVDYKQGILHLDDAARKEQKQKKDFTHKIEEVLELICGIANCAHRDSGYILIGVADSKKDAIRVEEIDGVRSRPAHTRHIVGINREFEYLGKTADDYIRIWKDKITKSGLSEPLKGAILTSIKYNPYYGLGVLVIEIPPQAEMSTYNKAVYRREGESNIKYDYSYNNKKVIDSITSKFNSKKA